ncbi:hypothetical protein BGX27_002102, partial [Mortierella sp. AM989]
ADVTATMCFASPIFGFVKKRTVVLVNILAGIQPTQYRPSLYHPSRVLLSIKTRLTLTSAWQMLGRATSTPLEC